MSASLVGSEMCIRDRGAVAQQEQHWAGRLGCRELHAANKGGQGQAPRGPVSYTHLTLPTICSV
eukprot:7595162-Alexandrium_andersonii.AAC.1